MLQLVPTMVRCQNPKCKEITEIVDYKSILEFSIILLKKNSLETPPRWRQPSAIDLNHEPSTQPRTSLIEIILTSPSDNAVEISTSDKNESEGDTDYRQFLLKISSQPNDPAGANDGTLSESEM